MGRDKIESTIPAEIDGHTKIYGIFGCPVKHTLSPALHNAAFRALGLNARYVPMHVEPANLADAVAGVRAMGIAGVNVTVPHKVAVADLLDEVQGVAAELNAVNVVINKDGVLLGFNTDVDGFSLSLKHAGVEPQDKHVVVLGAGGAGRSVVRALQKDGVESIALFNRTVEKAEALAEEFTGIGSPVEVWSFEDSEVDTLFENSMIIINTTSLGLKKEDPLPIDLKYLRRHHVLVDLIYSPWETPFLKAGRESGATTVNGYGMLVFQAMEAFALWTGEKPPLETMWDAGLKKS